MDLHLISLNFLFALNEVTNLTKKEKESCYSEKLETLGPPRRGSLWRIEKFSSHLLLQKFNNYQYKIYSDPIKKKPISRVTI